MNRHTMIMNQDSRLNKCEGSEPVFVIGASNQASPKMLYMIAAIAGLEGYPQSYIEELEQTTRDFADWQNSNTTKIKLPD